MRLAGLLTRVGVLLAWTLVLGACSTPGRPAPARGTPAAPAWVALMQPGRDALFAAWSNGDLGPEGLSRWRVSLVEAHAPGWALREADALEAQRRAVDSLGPDARALVVATLHRDAEIDRDLSERRFEAARPRAEGFLATRERLLGEESLAAVQARNSLARALRGCGRLDEALPVQERATAGYRRLLGDEHPAAAWSINNLARLHAARGEYERAEPLQALAMELFERYETESGDPRPAIQMAMNSGELALLMGRADLAEASLREAQARWASLGEEQSRQALWAGAKLAEVLLARRRLVEAQSQQRRTLDLQRGALGEDDPDTLWSQNNLARILRACGEPAEAEALLRDVLARRGVRLGRTHPDTIWTRANLGRLRWSQGERSDAILHLSQAMRDSLEVHGGTHPQTAMIASHLSEALADNGSVDEAIPMARSAFETLRETLGEEHPDTLIAMNAYARVLAGRDGASAITLINLYLLADARLAAAELPALTEPEKRARLARRSEAAGRLVTLVMNSPDPDRWGAEVVRAQLLEKNVLSDTTREELRTMLSLSTEREQRSLEELRALRRRYAALTIARDERLPAPDTGDTSAGELAAIESRLLAGGAAMRTRLLALAPHAGLASIDADTLAAALDADEAFVDYFVTAPRAAAGGPPEAARDRPRLGAIVLRRGTGGAASIRIVPLGPEWTIDLAVEDARKRLAASGGHEALLGESPAGVKLERLRVLLWDPLAPALAGVRRVYVSPAGSIHGVPFDALARRTDSGWRYLIEEGPQIVLVGSGRDLLRQRGPREPAGTGVLLVGDPDFGPPSGEAAGAVPADWTRAPSLGEFLASIRDDVRRRFPGVPVRLALGRGATEQAVLEARSPRVLAVATHGWYAPAAPDADPSLRSMLVMAGANRRAAARAEGSDPSDGLLTGYELMGADLRGTELVVLVACSSGMGDVRGDTGVNGIRRALAIAGARSVVSSLFEVPAEESVRQMQEFYSQWLGNRAPAGRYEAFRRAQLAALEHARRVRGNGHPFWWAGFVYTGDPGDRDAR